MCLIDWLSDSANICGLSFPLFCFQAVKATGVNDREESVAKGSSK